MSEKQTVTPSPVDLAVETPMDEPLPEMEEGSDNEDFGTDIAALHGIVVEEEKAQQASEELLMPTGWYTTVPPVPWQWRKFPAKTDDDGVVIPERLIVRFSPFLVDGPKGQKGRVPGGFVISPNLRKGASGQHDLASKLFLNAWNIAKNGGVDAGNLQTLVQYLTDYPVRVRVVRMKASDDGRFQAASRVMELGAVKS